MLDQYPVHDLIFVAALVVLWALGFSAGLKR